VSASRNNAILMIQKTAFMSNHRKGQQKTA
jgi:hypothetical protein